MSLSIGSTQSEKWRWKTACSACVRLGRDRLIALHEIPGLGGHLRPAAQAAADAAVQQGEAQALLGGVDDPPSLVVRHAQLLRRFAQRAVLLDPGQQAGGAVAESPAPVVQPQLVLQLHSWPLSFEH